MDSIFDQGVVARLSELNNTEFTKYMEKVKELREEKEHRDAREKRFRSAIEKLCQEDTADPYKVMVWRTEKTVFNVHHNVEDLRGDGKMPSCYINLSYNRKDVIDVGIMVGHFPFFENGREEILPGVAVTHMSINDVPFYYELSPLFVSYLNAAAKPNRMIELLAKRFITHTDYHPI